MEALLSISSEPYDTFYFERMLLKKGFGAIAGTDEAGRGPLAGPVVAASVILPPDCDYTCFRDSKQISEEQRCRLHEFLRASGALIGVGTVSPETIDRINILQATFLAMRQSIEALGRLGAEPDFILVDGTFTLPLATPQEALIKGDCRSASIAAASIVAKVTRDEIMARLHCRYPEYRFDTNKGYPTKAHRSAVARFGPSPVHRRTFKGVREFVAPTD